LKNLPTEKPSDAAGFLCTFLVEITGKTENNLRLEGKSNKKFPLFVESVYETGLYAAENY